MRARQSHHRLSLHPLLLRVHRRSRFQSVFWCVGLWCLWFHLQYTPSDLSRSPLYSHPQQMSTEEVNKARHAMKTLKEMNEKLMSRNDYLERKDAMYAAMKDELENANKLLGEMGAKTMQMADDLVRMAEVSKESEEFAKGLLQTVSLTSEQEKQAIEQQMAVVDAALLSTSGAQHLRQVDQVGEPCPHCRGKGTLDSSEQAQGAQAQPVLKKARTQPYSARTNVPRLTGVGKVVLLEDEDDDVNFSASTARLLKMVDQDFADVVATREQLRDIFVMPTPRKSPRSKSSPRKHEKTRPNQSGDSLRQVQKEVAVQPNKETWAKAPRHLMGAASSTDARAEVKDSKKSAEFDVEKMSALPILFPPLSGAAVTGTPRGESPGRRGRTGVPTVDSARIHSGTAYSRGSSVLGWETQRRAV